MEGLVTPDGKKVEADKVQEAQQDFARAMASDTTGSNDLPRKSPEADKAKDEPKKTRRRPGKSERARTTKTAPKAQSDQERKTGVQGLVQIGAGLAAMAGQATGNVAFQADAVTLAVNAEQLADACVATCKADPRFARVIDKVTAAGPYAALIGATMSVSMQVARNHKPELQLPGTVPPQEVLAQLEPQNADSQ